MRPPKSVQESSGTQKMPVQMPPTMPPTAWQPNDQRVIVTDLGLAEGNREVADGGNDEAHDERSRRLHEASSRGL